MITPQYQLDIHNELIIVNFAGGGGSCTGIELALGRNVDIAINHDEKALAMHRANHPQTKHFCESVWDVNPREITEGRPVGLVWLSPDCKHFSKAKGGKPVEKKIRGLAWVALRWAALTKPRVIMLENVEEFVTWGPLGKDGKPCKKNKGREFNAFINALKRHGYELQYKELRACDYGAPTIRKRLFLIARCDGQPIVWPQPTHGAPNSDLVKSKHLKPWRTAAECIDWEIPCPSIFERKKPLAEATQRRVAKGIMKYVVNSKKPFIVTMAHGEGEGKTKRWGSGVRELDAPLPTVTASGGYGLVTPFITEHANSSNQRSMPADEPLRTQCAQVKGGHFSVVAPSLVEVGYGEREGQQPRTQDIEKPLGTVVSSSVKHALVTALLAQFNTTGNGKPNVGHSAHEPVSTIIASGTQQGLVTAQLSNIIKMRGDNVGQATDEPLHTISAGGTHHAEVRAFLVKYYGTDQDPLLEDPLHTITTKDRFGLVIIKGLVYQITDIGLRMLWPKELFLAQGFPASYIYDRGLVYDQDGNLVWIPLTKTEQVRMVGNSVSPPLAQALVSANLPEMKARKLAA
jgi:DNA (cytosine-5)-methyltransferase 1